MIGQQVQFQKTKLQIKKKKKIDLKSGQCSPPLNCLMLLWFGLQPVFFFSLCTYITVIYLWSGFWLLKPAMRFSIISTQLRQWNHAGLLKWVGCGGEGRRQLQVRGGGWREEMTVGNYTCETRHRAHTPLMQTAVLQENIENLRMFRSWSEHSYTHTQQSHFISNIQKATLMIRELHPEDFQPLITMNPQCISSILIFISLFYIYMCIS